MYYLNELGLLCTLGADKASVRRALVQAGAPLPQPDTLLRPRGPYRVGEVDAGLAPLPAPLAGYDCRNNRLAAAALEQLATAVAAAVERYGAQRIGVVMATSTSGIAATEAALAVQRRGGDSSAGFHPRQGIMGGLGDFSAAFLGLHGPCYTLSTACSSSANAALSARRLLASGACDAVVFGGVDSLCELTLQGFGALEAQSAGCNRPFAADRDGINIGEAAAIFLMSREPRGPRLAGGGGSSDAYHISAPHPEGDGAWRAMSAALADAGLAPRDIDYLNLHGTGTPHNDSMESKAVARLFGEALACSSTKAYTGHTLGAAGALELGLCWLLLTTDEGWRLPPALYREQRDPALPAIHLADGAALPAVRRPRYCQSNSFAFGGSNVSLILERADD